MRAAPSPRDHRGTRRKDRSLVLPSPGIWRAPPSCARYVGRSRCNRVHSAGLDERRAARPYELGVQQGSVACIPGACRGAHRFVDQHGEPNVRRELALPRSRTHSGPSRGWRAITEKLREARQVSLRRLVSDVRPEANSQGPGGSPPPPIARRPTARLCETRLVRVLEINRASLGIPGGRTL